MDKEIKDEYPLMVSIKCCTYNQEKYIRDALDGFVMQKTNFRFEAIVHDDASTDGTADIIREYAERYPDIIKPIYETENLYSKHDGSLRRIMDAACTGKYIAYCEGDDYWIDPLKLQKQVDILEQNDDVTMVFSDFYTVDENGKSMFRERYEKFRTLSNSGEAFRKLLELGNYVMTLTTLYRREIVLHQIIRNSPVSLDYLLILTAAGFGKLYYISEKTGAYRRVPSGQMDSNIKNVENWINKIRFYIGRCYVEGKFRKCSKKDDFKIKCQFIRTAFYLFRIRKDKATLPQILVQYPSLLFHLIIVVYKSGFKKILNFIYTNLKYICQY